MLFGHNVVDLKGSLRVLRRKPTVLATRSRTIPYLPFKRAGHRSASAAAAPLF
jgi:hypothetical protein